MVDHLAVLTARGDHGVQREDVETFELERLGLPSTRRTLSILAGEPTACGARARLRLVRMTVR